MICLLSLFPLVAHSQPDVTMRLKQAERIGRQYPDSAFLLLKNAHLKALEEKDEAGAASALQQMGRICYHLGQYPQSLEFYLQADKLFRKTGHRDKLAETLNGMGILYYYNRQLPRAWKCYDEALAIYHSRQNKEGLAVTYGRIGHLYEKLQLYDSAFYYQHRALEQYEEIAHKKGMAKIRENIGSIYEDLEEYQKAYHHFSLALSLYEQNADYLSRIEVINNLGDIYRKTGRYQESLTETQKAVKLALQTNEIYQLSSAYRDIAKTYNLLNRNDSAFYYQELSRKYLLEIYSLDNNKQLAFLQVLHDTEKKDEEIRQLEAGRKTTIIITVAIVVVVLLVVALCLVIISRQRLKILGEQELSRQNKDIYETQHKLIQAELQNKRLMEESLKKELEVRSRELTTHTLHVIRKNQFLKNLRCELQDMAREDKRDHKRQLKQILTQINQSFHYDEYWEEFRGIFEQVHQEFFDKLKEYCQALTSSDLRLVALLKMNLSSADIATLLGISQDSLRVARYRLRKKLGLGQGESLPSFLQSL